MAMPSGSELLLIFGVVVLLFGAKKIPELAKGLGEGIRTFKNEMNDDNHPPAKLETSKGIDASSTTMTDASKEHSTQS